MTTTTKTRKSDTISFTGMTILGFGVAALMLGMAQPAHSASVYNNAVLADNPLLYWTFDEASGNAFSQVNNTTDNELAPAGNATRAASTTTNGGVSLGLAASFDGTAGTQFTAADLFGGGSSYIAGPDPWAVEFWFNTSSAGQQYISEGQAAGGGDDPAIIYGYNNGGSDELEAFKSGNRFGATGVSQNAWHHAVIAWYGNGGGTYPDNLREIYIDGVLVTSNTGAFSAGHALERFAIGSQYNGNNGFSGLIDEYAIYALDGADLAIRQARVADIAGHFNVADTATAPEPSSLILAVLGLFSLGSIRWRRRK